MSYFKTKTVAFAALLLFASATQAQQLGIGTMGQGTSGYSMGAAIARVLSENGIDALVQPSAGTSSYLPLIDMGELDLGIANAIEVSDAVSGNGYFEGHALENIAPAARLYPFRVGVFVRDDSGIQTVADLAGHSVTYGFTSQATMNRVLDAILAAGGLEPSDIEQVMVPNIVRGVNAFVTGQADGAFFAAGSGKVTEADASVGGIHFLPLPESDEAEARLQDVIPQAYVDTIEPREGLTGIDGPMPMMAYDYMLVVGTHVPDEEVARIVTILRDNKQALVDSFGAFQDMDPDAMYVDIDVPYHPGALSVLDTEERTDN
ncbi:TAXI family TRAP transporter solute-binding subunit [Chromohalobacter nigrandesensis]|uniref:TAXI family TRAP transporter solute-binding subunit n=1 Tax=Chromohalobacter nigrandesensis TaxID=119863 RepID=UPI001FF14801|nr:TAXI family TRAP transporter solute-binding subunit [Chromohalobacter nigrandesensis]MCK0745194.1 TAXI family TRAP transporter solute-binding subunit [Chromohalobacter nigrandesensis]